MSAEVDRNAPAGSGSVRVAVASGNVSGARANDSVETESGFESRGLIVNVQVGSVLSRRVELVRWLDFSKLLVMRWTSSVRIAVRHSSGGPNCPERASFAVLGSLCGTSEGRGDNASRGGEPRLPEGESAPGLAGGHGGEAAGGASGPPWSPKAAAKTMLLAPMSGVVSGATVSEANPSIRLNSSYETNAAAICGPRRERVRAWDERVVVAFAAGRQGAAA